MLANAADIVFGKKIDSIDAIAMMHVDDGIGCCYRLQLII